MKSYGSGATRSSQSDTRDWKHNNPTFLLITFLLHDFNFFPLDRDPASLEQRRRAFLIGVKSTKGACIPMNMIMKILSLSSLCQGSDLHLFKSKIRALISVCEPPPPCLNMLLWIMISFMTHSRGGLESFTVMQEILSACDGASVNPPSSGHCLLGQDDADDRFTPAASIRAARWSACASAPPFCPCSSDSLSSAAKCLPASDSQGTHPLGSTQTQTNSIRWPLFHRQTVRKPLR